MRTYAKTVSPNNTPQTEPLDSRQVLNNAGGYVYEVDPIQRLRRFLILGAEGGTYYASERKLTKENTADIEKLIAERGLAVLHEVQAVSINGRAPKNDAALFVLAMCIKHGSPSTKCTALGLIPAIVRTGTHLFQFMDNLKALEVGWGRSTKRGVGSWYTGKTDEQLAYQLLKYKQRGGWSHRDVLRLCHPAHRPILRWAVGKDATETLPGLIATHNNLHTMFEGEIPAATIEAVCRIIERTQGLTWEMLPTDALRSPQVWQALLPTMNLGAMVRNLGRMTSNQALEPLSNATNAVVIKLLDAGEIKRSKLHPISLLSALMTYRQGYGMRGSLTWTPIQAIESALEAAFYMSFGNVTPSNKRTMLALDVSGSMASGEIAGVPGLTPALASTAMAMVTARTEPLYEIKGFSDQFRDLGITASMSLKEAQKRTQDQNFGCTDCALPMTYALGLKMPVDLFVVYTDSETWCGSIHPTTALKQYRKTMGIDAKLVVCGMTDTGFTIADPADAGMLDVVGFDTATPELISDFAVGNL